MKNFVTRSRASIAASIVSLAFTVVGCGDNGPVLPDSPPPPDMRIPTPAALTISQATADFGSVTINETSPATTFTITNTGEAESGSISASLLGGSASQFSIDTNNCSSLGQNETCTIAVTFSPTSEGAKAANLVVTASPGGSVMAALSGEGEQVGTLSISPASQPFADQVVGGTSAPVTFNITNTGDQTTGAVTVAIAGNDPGQFMLGTDNCSGQTLDANEACTVQVTFRPTSVGIKSASVDVSAAGGNVVHGIVSGTAIADALMVAEVNIQPFGSVVENTDSNTATIVFTNTGDVASGLLTQTITGTDATQFQLVTGTCNAVVPAHQSCSVVVRFHPTSTMSKVATLAVSGTPGGTANVMLTGTGITDGNLTIDPPTAPFATTTVGATSASVTFTVRNTGASPTGAITAALAGMDASQFSIPAGTNACSAPLPGGGQCTVAVVFSPTIAGSKNAQLTISATPGANPPIFAALTGQALDAARLEFAPASPQSKDFGVVGLLNNSPYETFTIRNAGGTVSGPVMVALNGANATQFQLMNVNCSGNTLDPAETCTVQVRFSPTNNGAQNATVDFSATPGGSVSGQLFGIGASPAALQVNLMNFTFPGNSTPLMTLGSPATLIGTTDQKVFTITNTGGEPSGAISIPAPTGTGAGDYSLTADNCSGQVLISGQSCTVTVVFAPTLVGTRSGTFTASATPGGMTGFGVTGNAQRKYQLIMADTQSNPNPVPTVAYGQHPLNPLTPPATDFVVRNNTNVAATLSTTTPASYFANGTHGGTTNCNTSIASGSMCTVHLAYNPTAEATNSGVLTVQATAAAVDQATSNVNGSGIHSLSITPGSATFTPDTANGAVSSQTVTYTVSNMDNAPTSGPIGLFLSGSADFQILNGAGCAGVGITEGNSCTITVKFLPRSVTSNLTAVLHVNAFPGTIGAPSDEITANAVGNGVAAAAITVDNADFSTVFVGSTLNRTITFRNTGGVETGVLGAPTFNQPASGVYSIVTNNCAGFNLQPAGQANSACTVIVQYAPGNLLGVQENGSVSIGFDNGFSSGTATSSLTGRSRGSISVSASTVTFPDTVHQTTPSPTQTLTVHNESGSPVNIGALVISGGNGATVFDTPVNGCGANLGAGQDCVITIRYLATNATASPALLHSTTLTVNATTGATPSGQAESTLIGTSLSLTALSFTVPSLCGFPLATCSTRSFGNALQGTNGGTQTFTVRNSGGQPSGPITIALTGTGAGSYTILNNTCNMAVLGSLQSCTFDVRFNPAVATAAGDQTANITATSSTGNASPQAITGRVIATNGVTISDPSHVFPSQTVDVDDGSNAFDFRVQNTDNGSAVNIAVSFNNNITGGGTSTQYARQTGFLNDCGTSIAAGGFCIVRVYFKPQCNPGPAPACGTFDPSNLDVTRFLHVAVNGGPLSAAPYATLSGFALSRPNVTFASPLGELTGAQPTLALNFNTNTGAANGIGVGGTKDVVVTLHNSGNTPSGVVSISALSGANVNQFQIVGSTCTSVPANGDCTITVRFRPTQTLLQTASFTVQTATLSDGDQGGLVATVTINLSGTGLNAASISVNPSSPQNDDSLPNGRPVGLLDTTVQNFTYSNINGSESTGPVSFTLQDSTNFVIVAPTAGTPCATNGTEVIDAGESCSIGVQFHPQAVGTFASQVRATAAPGATPAVFGTLNARGISALTSTGCTADTCPAVSLGTATVTVNNALGTMPGAAGAITNVMISNRSGVEVGPLHSSISDNRISYTGDTCAGQVLPAGNSCMVSMRLNSTGAAASVNASLVVTGTVELLSGARPVNSVTVPLTGTIQ